MAGLPLKHVKTAFPAVYKAYWFDTPGHRQRCGGFFTLCASRRGGDRESFRENLSKKFNFANFSEAQDAWGRRELRVAKISVLNDAWRYQRRKKTKIKKGNKKVQVVLAWETSFALFSMHVG